jgi:exosome complex component RRP41
LREALEPAIFLEYYPKTIIDVFIQVLCADGGTRCAAVTAASLALADAGVSMRDLICGVAVGKISRPDPPTLVLDLSDIEDKEGLGDLPVAMMPRTKRFTLLQFDGLLTRDEMVKALNIARVGIEKINQIQIQTIKEKYEQIDKAIEEDIAEPEKEEE